MQIVRYCNGKSVNGDPCKRGIWGNDPEQLYCHAHSPKAQEEIEIATNHKNADELVGRRMRKQDPIRYQKMLTNT